MSNSAAAWLRTVAAIGSFDMPSVSWAAPRRRSVTRDRLPSWDATSQPTIRAIITMIPAWRVTLVHSYGSSKCRERSAS